MIGAVASAVVIIIAVALTVPDTAPTDTKKLIGALSTGITAFLTAGFISWTGDVKDSHLADHIKSEFFAKYGREGDSPSPGKMLFPVNSPAVRWVFSNEYAGIEGWGRKARLARAKGVELAIGSDQPSDTEGGCAGRTESREFTA